MGEPRATSGVLRLAVAMRGGVSLAVWIGGALAEIDRLRPHGEKDRFIHALMKATRFRQVEIDILAGASAGGLNAALGGFAMAHGRPMDLRDVWIDTADIDRLLKLDRDRPRRSILDGNYFRREVVDHLKQLVKGTSASSVAKGSPVEIFLAATVFGGISVRERADPLFSDRRREAVFHFRHLADSPEFSDLTGADAPDHVGTAARVSASFPAAFEPVEIRTEGFDGQLQLPDAEERPRSVQLLDGGIVDNIPVARAIRAVARAPASEPVRRWVVFLHPSPSVFTEPKRATVPEGPPSIPSVMVDLISGHGAETLLDDLDVLEEHNRNAESQKVQRYTLCARALRDPLAVASQNPLGSVDAYCLYALLDEPSSVLPWIPVGKAPPVSPIRHLTDDDRYALRLELLEELIHRNQSLRPFAQIVRLAHLGIEWIRWGEQHGAGPFTQQRVLTYDLLFTAQLLDAAIGSAFLHAPADRIRVMEKALDSAQLSSAVHALIQALGTEIEGDGRQRPLFDRLPVKERRTLELLAAGCLPEEAQYQSEPGTAPADETTSDRMLQSLSSMCKELYECTAQCQESAPSLMTLLIKAISDGASSQRVQTCLLATDVACAGLHRGYAVGAPQTLDYLRISGAAPSPLAMPDFAPDVVPKFKTIRVSEGGEIDPKTKLAGNKLSNFSAFISRRFRANDWMWGRMDAAAGMVDLILRPRHLADLPLDDLVDRIKEAVTSSFGEPSNEWMVAGQTLCRELWNRYSTEVRAELAVATCDQIEAPSSRYLVRTRQLILTRRHLELLVREGLFVFEQPLEPGGAPIAPPPPPTAENAGCAQQAKAGMQALIKRYEEGGRRIADIWGRRKTTALGVRVADRIARAIVTKKGPVAMMKRAALAAPLFLATDAALTRGAFLISWNALVNLVLLPRLATPARLVIGISSLALSSLFWKKCVYRVGRGAPRGRLSGVVAVALVVFGLGTTWCQRWWCHSPSPTEAASPGALLGSHWGLLRPAIAVAVATAIAAACLWIWASWGWKLVVSLVSGLALGWWTVMGAWLPPRPASLPMKILASVGSMWIPALVLGFGFTILALGFSPEDRGTPD